MRWMWMGLFIGWTAMAGGLCDSHLELHGSLFADARTHARSVMARGSQHVIIDQEHVARVARVLARANYTLSAPTWDYPPYPDHSQSFNDVFKYLLVLDSVNFMYVDPETDAVYADAQGGIGAGLLAARLTAHWAELSAPGALAKMTLARAHELFAAAHPLPELEVRVRLLNLVGQFLDRNVETDWRQWLKRFANARELAVFVHQNIGGFGDPFLKRAQLFTGMLVQRFRRDPDFPSNLKNTAGMTVYADYILPMVFERMGILRYSGKLRRQIAGQRWLPAGVGAEREIRAATIIAADLLLKQLHQEPAFKDKDVLWLDSALWLQGGEIEVPGSAMPPEVFLNPGMPHHRARTTHY